jgi:hypothetical protein
MSNRTSQCFEARELRTCVAVAFLMDLASAAASRRAFAKASTSWPEPSGDAKVVQVLCEDDCGIKAASLRRKVSAGSIYRNWSG